MSVSSLSLPAPRFGNDRVLTDGAPLASKPPQLVVAPAGVTGDESEGELLVAKLYSGVKDAILKPNEQELAGLPLPGKLQLIEALQQVVSLAAGEGMSLKDRDPSVAFLPGRLYKALRADIPGLGQDMDGLEKALSKTPLEINCQLAQGLVNLTYVYQTLSQPFPREFSLGLQRAVPSLLEGISSGNLSIQEVLAFSRKAKDQGSDFHVLVKPLYAAIRQEIYDLPPSASPATVARLTQGMRDITRAARLLNVELQDNPLQGLELTA